MFVVDAPKIETQATVTESYLGLADAHIYCDVGVWISGWIVLCL